MGVNNPHFVNEEVGNVIKKECSTEFRGEKEFIK